MRSERGAPPRRRPPRQRAKSLFACPSLAPRRGAQAPARARARAPMANPFDADFLGFGLWEVLRSAEGDAGVSPEEALDALRARALDAALPASNAKALAKVRALRARRGVARACQHPSMD
jgi:hypothetical protein